MKRLQDYTVGERDVESLHSHTAWREVMKIIFRKSDSSYHGTSLALVVLGRVTLVPRR